MKLGAWIFLDLNDYESNNIKGYRYFWIVIEHFSIVWTLLKKQKAQTLLILFENILKTSKSSLKLFETVDENNFSNKVVTDFTNQNKKMYCRFLSKRAVLS